MSKYTAERIAMSELVDDLLTTKQASHFLGICYDTLAKWRSEGRGPPYYKPSKNIFYRKSELYVWLSSRRHETSDTKPRDATVGAPSEPLVHTVL